jgi:glycosyltransferase involved in cell wall biosynthesis
MAISESLASQKAVISSNICGIPYMIKDEETGFLVNPLDDKDISEKILYLLEHPEVAKSMGINGKKYA